MDTLTNPLMAAGMGFFIIILMTSVLVIIAQWIIYSKARQPGWAAIIPLYNMIILLKIVGRPLWWIVWFMQLVIFDFLYILFQGPITGLWLMLSAITALVFSIIVTNGLSKSFGKSEAFTVGLVLLGFIFYPILAFGDATYIGPGGIPPSSDTNETECNNTTL